MIDLAVAVLWFILGVVVLGFAVWVALYFLHQVFSNLPSKLDQAVWGIFAILCLIYALTLLAGGGRIAFPRVGFISSAEAAELTTPIQDVIVVDLNAAAELATANGDANGAACWTALAGERINLIIIPKGAGLFQLAEAARLTRSQLQKPIISDAASKACGPVARDAGATLTQIAGRVGLAIAPLPFKGF